MDIDRLQEIMQSAQLVNISFHGIPVYIQEINLENQTATVFPLDEMENEQIVDLNGLYEEGPF
ncbi:H-type small acid-soluble spore protein [Virgibacillus soli]|uniref:Small, acid-soluble spore protein H n=1 Tax=Paracerasibacillus soli TaxID=480284 RepID=A0ABU5CTJ2_9BACI|nr:H-type small acid-soluble spore protein [Virgibacillus soli]MDY0409683.1 H-type small acid-soluble spore protein [Virgibacillus soli]